MSKITPISKDLFKQIFPYDEFKKILELFIQQAKLNKNTGRSNGNHQARFNTGAKLYNHFGQGAASKAPYINYWWISIYWNPEMHELVLAVYTDTEDLAGATFFPPKELSGIDATIPGKGRVTKLYSCSDDYIENDILELYEKFMEACAAMDKYEIEYQPPKDRYLTFGRQDHLADSITTINKHSLTTSNLMGYPDENTTEKPIDKLEVSAEENQKLSMTVKFNKDDRQMVVNAIYQLWEQTGISLSRGKLKQLPGISHRLYRDSKRGELFLVFGGVGDWHGIAEDQLDGICQAYKSMKPSIYFDDFSFGSLVLAEKNNESIDIFMGDLQDFLYNKDSLIKSIAGDYQFHYKRSGDIIEIRETGLKLWYFTSIPLSNFENGSDQVFEAVEKISHSANITSAKEALRQYSATSSPERVAHIVYRIVRNPKIAQLIKEDRNYICEICEREPFIQKNGKPYAEADHIEPLGGNYKGLDTPENMRCLCAQCHATITHGSDEVIKKLLESSKWQS